MTSKINCANANGLAASMRVGVSMLVGAIGFAACSTAQATDPQQIERRYGVSGAYVGEVPTPDGSLRGTVVPVTLADGRQAQLLIPLGRASGPHALYVRDADGLHPVQIADNIRREEVTRAPAVVARRAERPHSRQRSWEKEALIIGGAAGGGTAIGTLAGGRKGAAVGAAAGGIGGLIYDLATRDKR